MNLTKTLVMLLLLLAGSAYIYLYELGPAEQAEQAETLLADLDREQLESVVVTSGEASFRLENNGGEWAVVEPVRAATESAATRQFLRALTALTVRNSVPLESAAKSEEFGLDRPELTLEIAAGERRETLLFGKKHSFSGRRYARLVGAGSAALVDEGAFQELDKDLFDIRSKKVLEFSPDAVERMTLQRRRLGEAVLFKSDGYWRVQAFGDERKGDAELIEQILSSLAAMRAEEIIDAPGKDLSAYGLDQPLVGVQLENAEGAPAAPLLEIGEAGKEGAERRIFARVHGRQEVYRLGKRFYAKLLQPAHYYRDSTPFDELKIESLRSINVDSLENPLTSFSIQTSEVPGAGKVWAVADFGGAAEVAAEEPVLEFIDALFTLNVLYLSPEEHEGLSRDLQPVKSFDINFVEDQGEEVSYRLLIAGEVKSAEPADSSEDAPAPRYGTLKMGELDDAVPVILRGERWQRLNKEREQFLPRASESKE